LFGSYRDAVPSRFLYDLPASLVRRTDGALSEPPPGREFLGGTGTGHRVTVRREPRYEEENPPARPRKVRHPVFGEGKVESVQGEGDDRKIIARFPVYGVKKILVRAVAMEFLE
jgi:hypothetical protein